MNHYFSTRELSELCGVGETTVKRWSNMGLIRHHKTVGRHRKFKLEDVLEFISKNHITIPDEQLERLKLEKQSSENLDLGTEILLVKGDTEALASRLLDSLLAYNRDEAEVLLIKAFEQNLSFAVIFDNLIAPVMHSVGNLWANKRICAAEEHIISHILIEAIIRLKARYEARLSEKHRHQNGVATRLTVGTALHNGNGHSVGNRDVQNGEGQRTKNEPHVVVCTCPESELHEIPLLGVALVCQSLGFQVSYVGAAVPFKDLTQIIDEIEPEMVCMSFTTARLDTDKYRRYEQLKRYLKKRETRFVVGGQFLGEKKSQPITADCRARDCQELEQYIRENFEVSDDALKLSGQRS